MIGLPATMALVNAYGGTYLKVPIGKKDGKVKSDLIALIGDEKAAILMHHYAGERVAIARCASSLRNARAAEMIAKYDSGVSAAKLAKEFAMSERNVRSILKRVPEPLVVAA